MTDWPNRSDIRSYSLRGSLESSPGYLITGKRVIPVQSVHGRLGVKKEQEGNGNGMTCINIPTHDSV